MKLDRLGSSGGVAVSVNQREGKLMRLQKTSLGSVSILLVLSLALALPATADILVMTDGSRLEIEGEWIEKGRMIEFTLPNGTLGAVRASEVDLEASHAATRAAEEKAAEPPPEPKPEKAKPVHVFTDKDIPQAPLEVINANRSGVTARSLQVTDWSMDPSDDPGLERLLKGTVRNFGTVPVTSVALTANLIGTSADGEDVSVVRRARLDSNSLDVGESTEFEVRIRSVDASRFGTPSALDSADISFDVSFDAEEEEEEEEEGQEEESEE